MKTLKINSNNLKRATEILQSGGVVVYPTETAYGMAADPFNLAAVKKIFQIKGRDSKKQLPMIADSLKTVKRFFVLDKKEKELAQKFWPGALTIILKTRSLKLKNKEIAVRVSPNKVARELAKSLGGLIISTSANISGKSECYSASAVVKQFKNKKFQPDIILDDGVLKKSKPSTIVAIEKGKIKIIRQGEIWISKSVK